MSEWNLVLKKEMGEIIVGSYNSKKEAEEQIKYRNTLCRHLGYAPDVPYEVVKSISTKK
jgi:hypothetical protein